MAAVVEFATQSAGNHRSGARMRVLEYHDPALVHVEVPVRGTRRDMPDRLPGSLSDPDDGRIRQAPGILGARHLVASIAAALLVSCLLLAGSVLRADDHSGPGALWSTHHTPVRSGDYVVVGPGDTLRSVAVEYAPGADQARVVEEIRVLNGGERSVEVGQVLALPLLDR